MGRIFFYTPLHSNLPPPLPSATRRRHPLPLITSGERIPKSSTLIFLKFMKRFSHSIRLFRSYPTKSITGRPSEIKMSNMAAHKLPEQINGSLGMRLFKNSSNEMVRALYSPFVVCMAAGNLEIDTFRNYIAQDVHFLRAFSKAYEMVMEMADDDEAKLEVSKLRKSVLEELEMHGSFAKEWGVDLPNKSTPSAATTRYTDFILATASGTGDEVRALGEIVTPFEKTKLAAYTLGAMAPCMRLYAVLGKELKQLVGPDVNQPHPFQKWIDCYASEEFMRATLRIEVLLDKLSVTLVGEEINTIEKLYNRAMKLEADFFLAHTPAQKTVFPLVKKHNPDGECLFLFADFDLTCTVLDSCAILAELVVNTAPKSGENHSGNQLVPMSSSNLRSKWDELANEYTAEYEHYIESVFSSDKAENFDYEGLYKALEHVSGYEKKANMKVIDAGVLKGLNIDAIKQAGERLTFQDGCTNFFQTVVKNKKLNAKIHILSFCWCADLIRSSFASGGLNCLNVQANELIYDENSVSTGEIVRKIETPIDKAQAFTSILDNCRKDKKELTVYIGDSLGDLLCLLKADVGIVMGSSSTSLIRVGKHFGVSFIPLAEGLVRMQKECGDQELSCWKGLSGVLYTVSSWTEIHAFVLGF